MATKSDTVAAVNEADKADLVWGAENIGKEIDRTKQQVHYLHRIGALKGAVTKFGYKTLVGSRRRLRDLPFSKI